MQPVDIEIRSRSHALTLSHFWKSPLRVRPVFSRPIRGPVCRGGCAILFSASISNYPFSEPFSWRSLPRSRH
ncbi:hypothetical protein B0T21DRAFT_373682 [Apiosordaria backusii]|uniref:Uncharacterized protein n=1 Tax=Apiosordaria backusii TaxID=314023 RepID=A0AA40AT15_9PEZI|nr:hypothetical protein B0T21DRAFT_373682 [Apiosordaria backusii]